MKALLLKQSIFSSPSSTHGSGSPLEIYQSHAMAALQYNYHPTNCQWWVGSMTRATVPRLYSWDPSSSRTHIRSTFTQVQLVSLPPPSPTILCIICKTIFTVFACTSVCSAEVQCSWWSEWRSKDLKFIFFFYFSYSKYSHTPLLIDLGGEDMHVHV